MFGKIKFEKSKYPVIKICFWVLVVCSILMTLTIIYIHRYHFHINGINPPLKPITVNVELDRTINPGVILVCFDDYCKSPSNTSLIPAANLSTVYAAQFDWEDKDFLHKKIKNIHVAFNNKSKDLINHITGIDLYIGLDEYHYNLDDILKLQSKNVPVEIDDNKDDYTLYSFDKGNYTGLFNHLLFCLIAIVLCPKFFIAPYTWLFLAFLIYLFNKKEINLKINPKIFFSLVFTFLALYLILIIYNISQRTNSNDEFLKFVSVDIKRHPDYEIHVIAPEKSAEKMQDSENVIWHYIDTKKGELFDKISKEKFLKDKKTMLYFNSDSVDFTSVFLNNAKKMKIYITNLSQFGKITYELEK